MIGTIDRIKTREDGKPEFYCFVQSGKQNYFLHKSDLTNQWNELVNLVKSNKSVTISFEPVHGERGLRASKAEIVYN